MVSKTRILDLSSKDAFNASIVRIGGKYLLSYRQHNRRRSIGFAWLDDSLKPIAGSVIETDLAGNEDPRLLSTLGGAVYLSTNYHEIQISNRIEMRLLSFDSNLNVGIDRIIGKFDAIDNWPGYVKRVEKNWAPFEANETLWYVYSICPHRILRVDQRSGTVALVYETDFSRPAWLDRCFGNDLRLSAPPSKQNDGTFLGTWHTRAQGRYWTGFYEFEGTPPFRIRRFSATPAITPEDAEPRISTASPALNCIYICGMDVDEQREEILLSGGENDHSVVAVRLDLAAVRNALQEVTQQIPVVKRHGHTDVAIVHVTSTSNVGDEASAPSHNFDLGSVTRHDLVPKLNMRGRNVVVGGGGLLGAHYGPMIQTILTSQPRRLILWGVGLNDVWHTPPDWMREIDLVGCREFGLDYRWVPCSSCASTLFDIAKGPTRELVYFLHSGCKLPKITNGALVMKNNVRTMREAIQFLSSGHVVVTNSYHGAYWATLLGRRVIVLEPTADRAIKFRRMRHSPVILAGDETVEVAVRRTTTYPTALDECREANQVFYRDVMDALE